MSNLKIFNIPEERMIVKSKLSKKKFMKRLSECRFKSFNKMTVNDLNFINDIIITA